jgi:putative tricarboxylic transport membrane protein
MSEFLLNGALIIFQPLMLLMITFGVVLGVIFGALPGVSSSMAVALGISFTYIMSPVQSISFLVAVYCSAITGGGITAILFKIPGTPSSAPTTFDGYPMALRGEGDKALGISLMCSGVGGMFSAIAMMLLSSQLRDTALLFGPAELFAICFMGLSILTCLDSENMCRTIISGLMGLFMACVGIDPLMGVPRLTWGRGLLLSGFDMIPVMIGIFAVTEVLKQTISPRSLTAVSGKENSRTALPSYKEWLQIKWTVVRCAIIGTIVGILPGAGATIAAFLGYSAEAKFSKNSDKFGTGVIDGIAASETANNAATGGSMVPLLTLGIPGGPAAAIMGSALMLKGVQLGPLLLVRQPAYLSATFLSMVIANVLMVIVSILIARIFAKILHVPYSYLGPTIIILAAVGSFSTQNTLSDIKIMAIAGVIGYVFIQCKFNSAALVLGLVLGPMCETNLRRASIIRQGSITRIFSSPISIGVLLVSVLALLYPVFKPYIYDLIKRFK